MSLNNGSITHLVIRPNGRVALRTLGDTGFMPPDKITRTWGVKVLAASGLFALIHSATVPLDFYMLWCCLKNVLQPLCLLHAHSYLPSSKEKNSRPEAVLSSGIPQSSKLSCGIQKEWMSVCSAAARAPTFYSPVNSYSQSLLLWIFFLCRKIIAMGTVWTALYCTLQLKMCQLVLAVAEEVAKWRCSAVDRRKG